MLYIKCVLYVIFYEVKGKMKCSYLVLCFFSLESSNSDTISVVFLSLISNLCCVRCQLVFKSAMCHALKYVSNIEDNHTAGKSMLHAFLISTQKIDQNSPGIIL